MSTGATWHDEGSGRVVRAGADSQTGNYRERNEDLVLLDSEVPLALVLDGMGGEGAERATRTAAEAIRARVRIGHANDEPPEALLEAAFRSGHQAVLGHNTEFGNRWGATAVAVWAHGGRVYATWLGDSSALRMTRGRLERLTWDHNWANEAVRRGIISEEEARYGRVSRNLIRYLGQWDPDFELEIASFVPAPGDRLVLATDGVTGVLEDEVILTACRTISDPATCAEAIIEHALLFGSRDNCTCAVLSFDGTGAVPPELPVSPRPPARKWWRFWG